MEPDAGSRAHDDFTPAEVFCGTGDRIYQRQERDPSGASAPGKRKKNSVGENFWARGYLVSTVGRDEKVIREYIRKQEAEDKRLDHISLWRWTAFRLCRSTGLID